MPGRVRDEGHSINRTLKGRNQQEKGKNIWMIHEGHWQAKNWEQTSFFKIGEG